MPKPKLDPHCSACGTDLDLPNVCDTCGRGNLAAHSFCGWCGGALTYGEAHTAHAGQITMVTPASSPGTNAEPLRAPEEAEVTIPGSDGEVVGVNVVLLGTPEHGLRFTEEACFVLELDEPFDVMGEGVQTPASFTATEEGLRFDHPGDLDGDVFVRVAGSERADEARALRFERELGMFQALTEGEVIPPGSMAIIGTALVRVDPIK